MWHRRAIDFVSGGRRSRCKPSKLEFLRDPKRPRVMERITKTVNDDWREGKKTHVSSSFPRSRTLMRSPGIFVLTGFAPFPSVSTAFHHRDKDIRKSAILSLFICPLGQLPPPSRLRCCCTLLGSPDSKVRARPDDEMKVHNRFAAAYGGPWTSQTGDSLAIGRTHAPQLHFQLKTWKFEKFPRREIL